MRRRELFTLAAIVLVIWAWVRMDNDDVEYCARLGLTFSPELGTCVKVAKGGAP